MSGPRSLSRRDLLRAGGVTLAGGLAGCQAIGGEDSQATIDARTFTVESGTAPSDLAACAPDDTWELGPTHCVSDLEDPETLVVSPEAPELPNVTVRATLTNRTDTALGASLNDFALAKWAGGRWHWLHSASWPSSGELSPGESVSWPLTVDTTRLGWTYRELRQYYERNTEFVGYGCCPVLRLGAGTYSVVFTGDPPDGGWRVSGERREGVIGRRFTLSGDPLPVVPTRHVESVERNGDTVHVTSTRPERCDGGTTRRATLVVTRSDTLASSLPWEDTLLPEHLYGTVRSRHSAERFAAPLRNALVQFEDSVETVRVTTDVSGFPPFLSGSDDGSRVVGIGGRGYRLTTEQESDQPVSC